ncbi:MAG: mechanosensitive ion channel family protein [Firmicutes bacterium]|mgnify:FL=1|nr:mechanosensitive ion channel family protein [Bacillota bacterium]
MKEKTLEKLLEYGGNLLMAVVVFAVGMVLIKLALKITQKALEKTRLDKSVHKFVMTATRYTLYIILAVVILTSLKVPTAPLVTVLGACGAAVALALKDSLGNIASGIIILANKPFIRGDVIEVTGITGIVQSIDLLVTTLKTYDNKVITIPNGTITASVLVNYSREEKRRVDLTFTISYDSDIAKAKDVLLAVAESNSDIFADPAPVIGVAEHQDSAILLDLKVWCENSRYYDVRYYLEEQVKLAFDEANITIPYPQMDVRVIK